MAETTSEKSVSVRGLIDSDIGPLRRFTGILDSMPTEKQQPYGEGEKKKDRPDRVSFNFKDIEVIEAIEPYNFPIYTIAFSKSNRKKSKYGIFGLSLVDILDKQYTPEQLDPSSPEYVKPGDRADVDSCLGKRLGLVMTDGEDGRPAQVDLFDGRANDGKGGDVPTSTWTVYSVEGIGVTGDQGATPLDRAMELLDGKTLAEFNTAALADATVRGDAQLLQAIGMPASAKNSFSNQMIAGGQFTKDKTGMFHKKVG